MPGNKSRSKYARKRKFIGLRRQDIKNDDDNEERPNENDSRPGGSSTPDKLNRSFEKISENCPILKSEREQVLTRQKAFNLGLTSTVSHPSTEAFGNKIINSKLLDMALEKIAVCKMCKSSNGCLKLFQVDRRRSGLDESLYLECQNCHYSVNFHTTEKVDCLGKQHSEINLRLTQAGFYTGNGQTNLQRLCGMLDLPPPVNNSSYNDHLKDLELISAKVAENSMAQAAFRLKSILKMNSACANAVLIWNQGAGSQINLLKAMGITEPGVNTIKLLRNENAKRIFDASRKCKSSYQKRRRTLRHEKKKGTKTGEHYSSGAFSCSKPASQRRSGKKRNISLIEKPSEREVEIEFVNEESISVSIHPAKKRRAMK
eukprot:gene794-10524_t